MIYRPTGLSVLLSIRKAERFSVIYEGTLGHYVTSISCRAFVLFKFLILVTLLRKRSWKLSHDNVVLKERHSSSRRPNASWKTSSTDSSVQRVAERCATPESNRKVSIYWCRTSQVLMAKSCFLIRARKGGGVPTELAGQFEPHVTKSLHNISSHTHF